MNKRRQLSKHPRIETYLASQGQYSFRNEIALLKVIYLLAAASIILTIVFDSVCTGVSMAGTTVNPSAIGKASGGQMRQSSFIVQVDPNNTATRYAGSGYMKGTFYHYPSAWWNAWFYVGQCAPGQSKQVSTVLQVVPLDPNEEGYAEIAYAWSTPSWSDLYPGLPPLSRDAADMDIESKYIKRLPFGKINLQIGSGQQNVSHSHLIPEYSPEWLSIAVRGANFKVLNGRMMYEAGPRQMGQIEETRIREIVLQVIRENPALIHRTLNDYLQTQRQAQRQTQREENERRLLEKSFNNKVTDIQIGSCPAQGPKDAKITIFAFQDFECPHSQRSAKTFEPLLKQYTGQVRYVFKNRPLTFHQQAASAAKAALAAHMQGRFWEYHDLLFENSGKLGEEAFLRFAKELDLDIKKFNEDRNSKTIEERLSADIAEANKQGFRGTPTFVMNGVVVTGSRSQSYFNNIIKRLLEQ